MLRLFNMSYYFRIRKFILKIKTYSTGSIKTIIRKINDPELYALALLDVDIATKEYVLAEMNSELRIRVETELSKNGKQCRRKL